MSWPALPLAPGLVAVHRFIGRLRAAVGVRFALLAGATVLNVLKEEPSEERQSRFGAVALGAAGSAALLLAL